MLLCLATLLLAASTHAHRILAQPSNVPSHLLDFSHIAVALIARGHEVHMLVPNNTRVPSDVTPQISILRYDVTNPLPFIGSPENTKFLVRSLEAEGTLAWLRVVMEFRALLQEALHSECEDLLRNTALLRTLSENHYDLVLYDPMDRTCAPTLAYKLGVPMALVSLPALRWFYRVPAMPSCTPAVALSNTDVMSFSQRAKSMAFEVIYDLMSDTTTYFVEKYVPERPAKSGREIIREAVLWFYLHDNVLHYPIPLMPNTIDIGALMLREAKPLAEEYTALLNQSHSHVILMSLGTAQTHFPAQWIDKFCEAFRMLGPDILVIWKMNSPPECELPANVVTKSWLPQNDLLAHPKLKLFLTHAGWNSYAEATFHAKPMIGLPMMGDQGYNAAAMERKGLGVVMEMRTFTPQELVNNINNILSNDSYTANAQRQATLLRQQPIAASEKVAFWVEHVIQYGGEHLRNAGFNLSLYEFLMLDILAAVFIVVCVILFAMCVCCCLTLRALRACCHKPRKEKTA